MFATTLKFLPNRKYCIEPFTVYLSLSIQAVNYKLSYNKNGNLINVLNKYDQVRYKSYRHLLDYSKVPKLDKNDLEEQHVRGSGPGGQATNKTANAVILRHKSTGLVVKCHQTRSLFQNRKIAEEIMLTKLDNLINGEDSLQNQEERLKRRDSIKKKQKRKKLLELKESFKERENLK